MERNCSHCLKSLTPRELRKPESRGMESERKALGLEGIFFRYYQCAQCGKADIFVDIHPLDHESPAEFRCRRDELEAAIARLPREQPDVVLVERHAGFSVWA